MAASLHLQPLATQDLCLSKSIIVGPEHYLIPDFMFTPRTLVSVNSRTVGHGYFPHLAYETFTPSNVWKKSVLRCQYKKGLPVGAAVNIYMTVY
jgi:hypothetical protein